jgi:hypothetical protein
MARARLRWGLPDVLLAWLAGVLASLFALPLADPDLSTADQPVRFILAALLLQNLGIVLALIVISDRKGQRSLGRDFGIVWPFDRLRVGAVVGWVAAGAGLSLVAAALLRPIADLANLDDSAQQVSKSVENASGAGLGLLLVGVVLVAPVVEELLFRGVLLRALQRRFTVPVAVFVSAAVFAGVHVVGDPGSYYVVPGLLVLGLVSGWQAATTGDLSRSILLHLGFNLLSALSLALA